MKTIRSQIPVHFFCYNSDCYNLIDQCCHWSIRKNVVPLTMSMNIAASGAKANEIGALVKGYTREVQTLTGDTIFKTGYIYKIKRELIRRKEFINHDFR